MKKINWIIPMTIFCFACSNSNNADTSNTVTNDSATNQDTISTPPGLGIDPSRKDATKPNPTSGNATADSAIHKNNPGATPGLGNDPTRNDASKTPSDRTNPSPEKDTGKKKN